MPGILNQDNPDALAKNSKFLPTKVFVVMALVLVGVILAAVSSWYFVKNSSKSHTSSPDKIASSSSSAKTKNTQPPSSTLKTYTKTTEKYSYSLSYPSDWSYEETQTNHTKFYFNDPSTKNITVTIINYKETPPLPCDPTFTLVRTVKSSAGSNIQVKKNSCTYPGLYGASIEKGDYTANIVFGDSSSQYYDSVFDTIISSFKFN